MPARHPRVALFASLLLPISLPAQDEPRTLAAFGKAFAPAAKGKAPREVADMRTALQATTGLDSAKTAEVIVGGFHQLTTDLTAIDAERAAGGSEIAELLKGQEASEHRTLPKDKLDRLKELQARMTSLGDEADGQRALQLDVGERVAALRRRDAVLWLLQKVINNMRARCATSCASSTSTRKPG